MKDDDYLLKAELLFKRLDKCLQNGQRFVLALALAVFVYLIYLFVRG